MNDGTEMRCAGRLYHRLAAETGRARLQTVAMKIKTKNLEYWTLV